MIIPNHKFLTSTLFNWTENGVITKECVSIGVSYDSNVDKVTNFLVDIAKSNNAVLEKPKPFVLFEDFGDNAIKFKIFFAVKRSYESNLIKSEIRYAIFKKFQDERIKIPFPQRTINFLNHSK